MKKIGIILFVVICSSISYGQEELSIAQAIEKALSNNYQIKLVKGNYEVSQLQNSWGMAGLVPTFTLNATNSAALISNDNPQQVVSGLFLTDNLQASVGMQWTLFSGFGIKINKERFDQLEEQTKGNAIVVIENTIYEVIMAYYTSVTQERKLEILEDMLSYSKDKRDYFLMKSDLGINTSIDLLEFENQVLTDSSNYLLQLLSYRNSMRNLNLVMGEYTELKYKLTDKLEVEIPDVTYGELEQLMGSNNQNLKNQYINYELQELNLEAKRASYYPVVTLNLTGSPTVGYFKLLEDPGFSTNTGSSTLSGSISASYTIFNGYQRKRNVQIAEIQRDLAMLQTDEMKLDLSHQLRGIFELYQTQAKIEDMALSRVDHSKLLWEMGNEKYDLGLINIFNLNDIKLAYEQSVLNYYDRLFDLVKTHYDLLRITGGISQEYKIEEGIDNE